MENLSNTMFDYKDDHLKMKPQKKVTLNSNRNKSNQGSNKFTDSSFWDQFETVDENDPNNKEGMIIEESMLPTQDSVQAKTNPLDDSSFWDQFETVDENDPNNKEGMIIEDSAPLLSNQNETPRAQEPSNTPSYFDRAKEFAKPIVADVAMVGDMIGKGNSYVNNKMADVAGAYGDNFVSNYYRKSANLTKDLSLEDKVNNSDFFKKDYEPDTISKVNEGLGAATSLILPFNAVSKSLNVIGKGGKILRLPVVDKIASILKTPLNRMGLSTAAGASIGSTLAVDSLTNEDSETSAKVAASILGSIVGGVSLNVTTAFGQSSLSSLKEITKDVYNASTDPSYISKNLSAKEIARLLPDDIINKEALKTIGSDKIDLVSIVQPGKLPKALAYFLPEKTLQASLKNLNNQSIKEIEKKLDSQVFNKQNIPDDNSFYLELEDLLKTSVKKSRDAAKSLYDKTDLSISDSDKIIPTILKDTIAEIKPIYNALSIKPRTTFNNVLNMLDKSLLKDGVPLKKLSQQRAALRAYKQDLPFEKGGEKLHVQQLIDAIDQGILDSAKNGGLKNKDYIDNFKNAREYYKDVHAPLVKTELTKTILTGQKPYHLYESLKSVNGIVEFNQHIKSIMLANPSKATEVKKLSDILKRNKLEEFLFEKTKTNTDSSKLNFKYLDNVFDTETHRNYLRELAGNDLYKSLRDHQKQISPIFTNLENMIKEASSKAGGGIDTAKGSLKYIAPAYILGSKGFAALIGGKVGLNQLAVKINSNERLMQMFLNKINSNNDVSAETWSFLNTLINKIVVNANEQM